MKKKILLLLSLAFILCLLAVGVSASDHNVAESLTYENGFLSEGVYSSVCSCGQASCENNISSTEEAPLFVILGYSTPENEDSQRGLSFSYQADIGLIEKYEEINNCKITTV